jgi:hypothetical protein
MIVALAFVPDGDIFKICEKLLDYFLNSHGGDLDLVNFFTLVCGQ